MTLYSFLSLFFYYVFIIPGKESEADTSSTMVYQFILTVVFYRSLCPAADLIGCCKLLLLLHPTVHKLFWRNPSPPEETSLAASGIFFLGGGAGEVRSTKGGLVGGRGSPRGGFRGSFQKGCKKSMKNLQFLKFSRKFRDFLIFFKFIEFSAKIWTKI